MIVRCAQCGEELLGVVNRCWKCGSSIAASPDAQQAPAVITPRIGSPFAGEAHIKPRQMYLSPLKLDRTRSTAACVGLGLGLVAWLAAFVTPVGAISVAIFGIALCCWGLFSQLRSFAIVGLIICTLVFGMYAWRTVSDLIQLGGGAVPAQEDEDAEGPDALGPDALDPDGL